MSRNHNYLVQLYKKANNGSELLRQDMQQDINTKYQQLNCIQRAQVISLQYGLCVDLHYILSADANSHTNKLLALTNLYYDWSVHLMDLSQFNYAKACLFPEDSSYLEGAKKYADEAILKMSLAASEDDLTAYKAFRQQLDGSLARPQAQQSNTTLNHELPQTEALNKRYITANENSESLRRKMINLYSNLNAADILVYTLESETLDLEYRLIVDLYSLVNSESKSKLPSLASIYYDWAVHLMDLCLFHKECNARINTANAFLHLRKAKECADATVAAMTESVKYYEQELKTVSSSSRKTETNDSEAASELRRYQSIQNQLSERIETVEAEMRERGNIKIYRNGHIFYPRKKVKTSDSDVVNNENDGFALTASGKR